MDYNVLKLETNNFGMETANHPETMTNKYCTFTGQLTWWTVYSGNHPMCTGQVALSKTTGLLRAVRWQQFGSINANMTEANDSLHSGE